MKSSTMALIALVLAGAFGSALWSSRIHRYRRNARKEAPTGRHLARLAAAEAKRARRRERNRRERV